MVRLLVDITQCLLKLTRLETSPKEQLTSLSARERSMKHCGAYVKQPECYYVAACAEQDMSDRVLSFVTIHRYSSSMARKM